MLESDLNYLYFIEQKNDLKQLIQFDLANFNSSFETDTFKKILNNDIINFEWSDGFFLLTAKSEVNFISIKFIFETQTIFFVEI